MAQAADNRLECALINMLNEVDKLHLRQIQAEMHKCAAKCCEDKESSMELVHACVELCGQNLKKAQKVVQEEFAELQQNLQGCALFCNNETKKTLSKEPIENQIKMYSSTFDNCIESCIDSNIALIPFIMKKMKEILANKPPEPTKKRTE